jgi:predicted nucleic acid-binding protein
MTFVDSSFAIEWLLGRSRAKIIQLEADSYSVLGNQYVEILIFFLKLGKKTEDIVRQLEFLEFITPEKEDWISAGMLYSEARQQKSKASLADAVLAAIVIREEGKLLSFDHDFRSLRLKEMKAGIWE